ncbi:MAG TPA: hypothetical protein K8V54_01605 [Corynebacterium kroppenstedtii]|nr:hypothetical protein [Corynebacterium kroppenstedtii]
MAITPGDVERLRQERLAEANKSLEELSAELSAHMYGILDGDPSELSAEADRLEKAHDLLHQALEDSRD